MPIWAGCVGAMLCSVWFLCSTELALQFIPSQLRQNIRGLVLVDLYLGVPGPICMEAPTDCPGVLSGFLIMWHWKKNHLMI
jgi:hypothetical protein